MVERIRVTKKHLEFSIKWKGDRLGIFEMRRHYTNYFKGIPDFKPYRMRLVEADTFNDVVAILDEVSEDYSKIAISI
jgi:tRNA-dihydrouridine synthase